MDRDLAQKMVDVLTRATEALERLAPVPEAQQEEQPAEKPAKAKNKEVK